MILPSIDRGSEIPIHSQITTEVQSLIDDGTLGVGTALREMSSRRSGT
jgi:DNA-binding transcriptional regulator YhcF (GntR family)